MPSTTVAPAVLAVGPLARFEKTPRARFDLRCVSPPARSLPLDLVLPLPLGDRLPLEIARLVLPATCERNDVIDDVARSPMRIARLPPGGLGRGPLTGRPRG